MANQQQACITFKTPRRFIFVAILSCFVALNISLAGASEVRWQGANDVNTDPAHTSPRSQKYWDEHGIERPEYGKTDGEIAQGSPERTSWATAGIVFLVCCIVGVLAGMWLRPEIAAMAGTGTAGTRLGSTQQGGGLSSLLSRGSQGDDPEEKARRARLAHFDVKLD